MNVHAGTGSSSKADAFEAGRSAAQDAVNQLGSEAPAMVFVFTSPRYILFWSNSKDKSLVSIDISGIFTSRL